MRKFPVVILSFLLALSFHSVINAAKTSVPKPLLAVVSQTGDVAVTLEGNPVLRVAPVAYLKGWSGTKTITTGKKDGDGKVNGDASIKPAPDGKSIEFDYTLSTTGDLPVEIVCASIGFTASQWTEAPFSIGTKSGQVPVTKGEVWLGSGNDVKEMSLGPSKDLDGLKFTLQRREPGFTMFQDSRQWSDSLEVRVSAKPSGDAYTWSAGDTQKIAFTIAFNRPVKVEHDEPVEMKANADWIPLAGNLEVEPGSALDWSDQVWRHAVAGEKGWLRASKTKPGSFEFEKEPGKAVRLYGSNLCYSALYPDTKEESDRLAARLKRLGYNAIRIHHYESVPWDDKAGIVDPKAADSLTFNAANLDKLDYLFAALKKQGIYMTTDLYVNRAVKASEVFDGGEGATDFRMKTLVHVSPRAFENWKEFARRFLGHVNPYTGLAYKDDPAMALISLLNEDPVTNYIGDMKSDPREKALWDAAYEKWCRDKGLSVTDWDSPQFKAYLLETQRADEGKMIAFLRDELGCQAMLTDMNASWPEYCGIELARGGMDYVDNHFYWDHPSFMEQSWNLPSRGGSGGGSSIRSGGEVMGVAQTRLLDKPFTITEFNYAAPNAFRAEGGLLTGAYAALQDWGGLWRFAYSHGREILFTPGGSDYFNMASDPLRQASEYAAVALFLRGDAAPAAHAVAVVASEQELKEHAADTYYAGFNALGWSLRVGSLVGMVDPVSSRLDLTLSDRNMATKDLLSELKVKGFLPAGNATDPAAGIFESENGQTRLDEKAGIFTVNTPRTAGVSGPEGTSEKSLGPLSVSLSQSWATVFATSLDGKSLDKSRHILLAHLTDLKNTGMRFRGRDMQVLEKWGETPYLVRAGKAAVRLRNASAKLLKVWRLGVSGKRLAQVPARVKAGALEFTADTATTPDATLYYEIAEK